MTTHAKQWIIIVAGFMTLGVVGRELLRWDENRMPVPASRLGRLRDGMDTNEVRQIIGPPSSFSSVTNASGDFEERWLYLRWLGGPFVVVQFRPNGTVTNVEITKLHRDGSPPTHELYLPKGSSLLSH
jgi:hypothetical protein